MAASQLRFSPLSNTFKNHSPSSILRTRVNPISLRITGSSSSSTHRLTTDSGNSGFHGGSGGGGSSGNNNNGWSSSDGDAHGGSGSGSRNVVDAFFSGWRSRVAADPEFPFKVLMEEVVGVSATAVGDMASRPNFGLSELDLVLSTLIVGSIVNFVLMYLLAPTTCSTSAAAATASLPSYIFQPGNFSLLARTSTFFYKGLLFSAVGFVSGLVGTTLSNSLVSIKNNNNNSKDEEGVENKKKKKGGPPTVLNAATWAVHMGLSSNLRYQTLNGVEFVMVRSMPPGLFKMAVLLLRGLNNVLGGMSFVALGKIMGSQKVSSD